MCVYYPISNDPLVMTHARALLTSSPEGRTTYIEADLREPDVILAHPQLRETLELAQPVGLIVVAVLHFVAGDGAAKPIVETLLDALPPGSFLVATHATIDFSPPEHQAVHRKMREEGRSDVWTRDRAEFTTIFDGLELVEPGVVPVNEWRPDADTEQADPRDVAIWGAVGRKSA